jgi:hypothetical protein
MTQREPYKLNSWDLDMSKDHSTPPLWCGNMGSARLAGTVIDGNSWTNTVKVQLFASVDSAEWVAIGDKITGGSASAQVSTLTDIRGYNWLRAIVTNKKIGTLEVRVSIALSPFRVDEVHSISALASPPTDGSLLYYDTGYDCLVEYDEGRGHWFGPLFPMTFGKSTTVSDGDRLAFEGGSVTSNASRGWMTARQTTCVGIEESSSGTFTGSIELVEDTTGSGVSLTVTAADNASQMTTDHDWDITKHLGVMANISAGTPTNMIVVTWNRWRVQ